MSEGLWFGRSFVNQRFVQFGQLADFVTRSDAFSTPYADSQPATSPGFIRDFGDQHICTFPTYDTVYRSSAVLYFSEKLALQ